MTAFPPPRHAWIELHAAVFLFGLAGLFARLVPLPALAIVLGRTFFGAMALFAALRLFEREAQSFPAGRRGWVALAGAVLAFHWWSFFQSIQVSTVAVGLLTFSSYPLWVTLLEPIAFRERRRTADWLTALGVVAGLALIVPDFDLRNRTTLGAFWGVLSGFSFALLSLLNRRLVREASAVALAAGQNAVAAVVILPFVIATGVRPALPDVLWLVVLGVVCTALAHVLFIRSLGPIRAQVTSVIAGLEAVYGLMFAALLFGEIPTLRTLCGGAVILGAVTLATLREGVGR
jgi:drug/metabolite transporter (DMT)-like permease